MSDPEASGHAFLSYVREDSIAIDALQANLDSADIAVWRDTAHLWPGEDWRAKIRAAITDNSIAFIACFSSASVAKEKSYQRQELVLAIEQLRLRNPALPWLIPVRLDDCEIPDLDIGAGRTLNSLQRVDLFGPSAASGLTRLVATVLRILGVSAAAPTPSPSTAPGDVTGKMKALLPHPERDIELEDFITDTVDTAIDALLDTNDFPSRANDAYRAHPERAIADRTHQYDRVLSPVVETLTAAAIWGHDRHQPLLRRAVEGVASTIAAQRTGLESLVDLRAYAVLPLLYGTAIAAASRGNWAALRTVSELAHTRNIQGERVPLVAYANPWTPFASQEIAASFLAYETDGTELTDDQISQLGSRRLGRKFTPISSHLQHALRPQFARLIRTDDDYFDAFDDAEVTLAVVAADAAAQAKAKNLYLHPPWGGAFTWRRRYDQEPFEIAAWRRHRSALLSAGFFGGDNARAEAAFETFRTEADLTRRNNR